MPGFRRKWKGSLQWEAEYDPFSKGQAGFKYIQASRELCSVWTMTYCKKTGHGRPVGSSSG